MNSFSIKTKPAVKYFKDDKILYESQDNEENQKEKIKLIFNLLNGKKNNSYGIKVLIPDKNFCDDSFFSNMVKCTNSSKINVATYNDCDFIFGKEQKLQIELIVHSKNNKSYKIYTTIGEIVGSENSTKYFYINGTEEKIEVIAQKIRKKNYLTVHFKLELSSSHNVKIHPKQKEDYFKNEEYKIYFMIMNKNSKLYESEAFTDDGKFNIVQIPIKLLKSNYDYDIVFFDYKNQIIGKANKSLGHILEQGNNLIFQYKLSFTDTMNIYNYSSIKDEITFLDYIKNGVQVALDLGIDFTGSNGHPDDKNTLHCRRPDAKQRNPYERAILSCAKIMANYDYDQLFPVYGFGAIINAQKEKGTSDCFNINFQQDPNIQFVDNIIKEYYACLDKITFSGPTNFTPIINNIINEIKKENNKFTYHVLMMLTDGKIDDFYDTVDALVEGSFLPLSVIIIGIGDSEANLNDFKFMEQLDADDIPLISRNGKKRQRDLVQFVPFYKFEGNEKKLAEEVLDEIPRQIIEYYTLNFIYPEDLINYSNNNNQSISNSSNNNNQLKASLNQSMHLINNSNAIQYNNHNNNYYGPNYNFNNFNNNNNYQNNNNNNSSRSYNTPEDSDNINSNFHGFNNIYNKKKPIK